MSTRNRHRFQKLVETLDISPEAKGELYTYAGFRQPRYEYDGAQIVTVRLGGENYAYLWADTDHPLQVGDDVLLPASNSYPSRIEQVAALGSVYDGEYGWVYVTRAASDD